MQICIIHAIQNNNQIVKHCKITGTCYWSIVLYNAAILCCFQSKVNIKSNFTCHIVSEILNLCSRQNTEQTTCGKKVFMFMPCCQLWSLTLLIISNVYRLQKQELISSTSAFSSRMELFLHLYTCTSQCWTNYYSHKWTFK